MEVIFLMLKVIAVVADIVTIFMFIESRIEKHMEAKKK